MRKAILVFCIFSALRGYGQEARSYVYWKAGLTLSSAKYSPDDVLHYAGIVLGPGFRFVQNKNIDVSISMPINLGQAWFAGTYTSYLAYDLPMVFDVAIGKVLLGTGSGYFGVWDGGLEGKSLDFFYQRFHAGYHSRTTNPVIIAFSYGKSYSNSYELYSLSIQFLINRFKKVKPGVDQTNKTN